MDICTKFKKMTVKDGAYIIETDNAFIKLVFMKDDMIRIRASFTGEFAEESYVLMTTAWADRFDDMFKGERTRLVPLMPQPKEDDDKLVFETGSLRLVINKDKFAISIFDNEGNLIYGSLPGMSFVKDSNNRVLSYSLMEEDDCFYGFGEKTGELNKNHDFIRERATDCMGYNAKKAGTLYKHIPFYIRLNRSNKKSVGVFYNNFFESVFNMGGERSNYWPRYSYFSADGGDLDMFILSGSIKEIIDGYTQLTGRPALLPKRALGYQGSSMYYAEIEKDADDAVLDFISTIKEEDFPIDGFHLSSGYTSLNNKRYVFNWNNDRFKDPEGFFKSMAEKGAEVVPNVKPGVLLTHPKFDEFEKKGVFVRDSKSSEKTAVGLWWGGEGAFWDFTKPSAREEWKHYLNEALLSKGTSSVWNDNCEYDSLADKDTECDFDGKKWTIGALKPIMSTLMCRVTDEAVKEYTNRRPYIVCRSGSSGIQKYAQNWCGDNNTSWESLKYNVPTILGMGLSGQPNEGADIGGFAGPAPSMELFVRWVQNGIFQPRFSIHSASTDNTVTEPWMFSDATDHIRDLIKLRYSFTPYLYSALCEANRKGTPIMRALVCDFQNDSKVYDESFEFMFGPAILVANILEEGVTEKEIYLPAGAKWYDLSDYYHEYEGGMKIMKAVTLESVPTFLKEGSMAVLADNEIYNMEHDKVTDIHLIVAPYVTGNNQDKTAAEAFTYNVYDDDGVSEDYKNGAYRRTNITVGSGEKVIMNFDAEGTYEDSVERVSITLIAKEKSPFYVTLNGEKLEHFLNRNKFEECESGWYYSQSNKTVEVKYDNPNVKSELIVSFEKFDLVGM